MYNWISTNRHRTFRCMSDTGLLSQADALRLFKNRDMDFVQSFCDVLAGHSFEAHMWECAPFRPILLEAPFEFTLTRSAELATIPAADDVPFVEHLRKARTAVVTSFQSRSGTTLIIPTLTASGDKRHLAAFMRTSSVAHIVALFARAAELVLAAAAPTTYWSTHGLGVSWLHLRVESTPRFFHHVPYTTPQISPGKTRSSSSSRRTPAT